MTDDEPRTYRTKSGRVLTDADIEALAKEAERGYDVERLCMQPCCVAARERRALWAEYISLVRVVVRARTGQRIIGRD